MKRKSLIVICLMLVGMFTANVTFAQMDNDMKAKVDKINSAYTTAMLRGNDDQLLMLYAKDAICMPSYSPMLVGIDAIKKASMEDKKSGWKTTAFELKSTKLLTAGNLVTDIGTYKMSMKMEGSDKMMDDHGKYLTILEKQSDGSLKIKVDTWNSDVNPWSKMKEDQQTNK
jgi:ketosteroid isomerase-like protein